MRVRLNVRSISAFFAVCGEWRTGALILILAVLLSACSEIQKPSTEPFISETTPPKKQEFRWSNGGVIKSLDPALALAPPETDVVRAVYEGLSELDPKTLADRPAAAEKWAPSDNFRTWTFTIRKNAKWSDGTPVTAGDFVRSWKRLASVSPAGSAELLTDNIVGMRELRKAAKDKQTSNQKPNARPPNDIAANIENAGPEPTPSEPKAKKEIVFGAKALDDDTLEVTLVNPDKDFPKLVTHPIFSPVPKGVDFAANKPSDFVTNGAFGVIASDQNGVTLARSEQYWNRNAVQLEEVRFVPYPNSEAALQAYRAGEVDALTNADFEPLALKLLTPYEDFRQTVHNALNFYEFNLGQTPYTDRRVREALTVSLERDRLTEGEMKGSTQSALHLFPFDTVSESLFEEDVEKAKRLLAEAGYPNGENFPTVRLVVNRNDTQQRIARLIAKMWKANLNIDTELITKENAEMESVRSSGEFDLIRRGLVFPTVDRHTSLAAIFLPKPEKLAAAAEFLEPLRPSETNSNMSTAPRADKNAVDRRQRLPIESDPAVLESTLEDAVFEFRVMPLYFPVSYSMVKPYVQGFDINGLDAPTLKSVTINSDWQPNRK